MSVAGLCEICEQNTVEYSCQRCGQLVCEDHYEEARGLCTACLAELGGEGESPPRPDQPDQPERPDGVDTYEF